MLHDASSPVAPPPSRESYPERACPRWAPRGNPNDGHHEPDELSRRCEQLQRLRTTVGLELRSHVPALALGRTPPDGVPCPVPAGRRHLKFFDIPQAVAGMNQLGWAPSLAPMLGVVLLSCLALYAFPRTAVLGAVLLTGYLGGAVATQVRVGNPILSHVLFPVYVAVMLWGGLWFRDARLRALMPLRGGAD